MNKKNLISIITPLHNCEKYILDTIHSITSQTYKNWELIIIDDNSTDNSYELVKKIASSDKRIKLYQNNLNIGPAKTRNKAIELAKGRFIAFLDSDDKWTSDKLEKQISFMLKNDIAFSHTGYLKINESNNLVSNKVVIPPSVVNYKKALLYNPIGCLTAIYDSEKLGKVYLPDIKKRQDYALWLKILKNGLLCYGIKESLAFYRIRTNSISSNKIKLIKFNWKIYHELEGFSIIKSIFYTLSWAIHGYLKYRK